MLRSLRPPPGCPSRAAWTPAHIPGKTPCHAASGQDAQGASAIGDHEEVQQDRLVIHLYSDDH